MPPSPGARPRRRGLVLVLILLGAGRAEAGFAITDLGVLGPGQASGATGINASGATAGTNDGAAMQAVQAGAGGVFHAINTAGLPGVTASSAAAIGDSGAVTGTFIDGLDRTTHAFVATGGVATDLGTFADPRFRGASSQGVAISSAGQVLGDAELRDGSHVVFRATGPGSVATIALPGGSLSGSAGGINAQGVAVGSYLNPLGLSRIFTAAGDTATQVVPTNPASGFGLNAYGVAINNAGTIAGYGDFAGGSHAFIISARGSLVDIGVTDGFSSSVAAGLNNLGQVVGTLSSGGSGGHAFFWDQAVGLFDLNTLLDPAERASWVLTSATGINDRDQIAGQGYVNGQLHGFVLTPVPGTETFFPAAGVPCPPLGLDGGGRARVARRLVPAQARANSAPGNRLMSRRSSSRLSVAITCDADSPLAAINWSTATGRSPRRSNTSRSASDRTSPAAGVGAEAGAGGPVPGLCRGGAGDLADLGAEFFEDVVDGLDQPGTVADQVVAAPAGQAVDRPGDGEDLAVLLGGVRRRRERAAPRGRLDHHHAQREPGDDPVPHAGTARRAAPGASATRSAGPPSRGHRVGELAVLGRVDLAQAVGEHGHRPAAAGERPPVRRGVDPPGQAGDDRQADPGERRGQPLGDPEAIRRALPRARRWRRRGGRPARSSRGRRAGRAGRGSRRAAGDRRASRVRSASRPGAGRAPRSASASTSRSARAISGGQRAPHAGDVADGRLGGRGERPTGRAEPLQQRAARLRPDPGDRRQADQVEEVGLAHRPARVRLAHVRSRRVRVPSIAPPSARRHGRHDHRAEDLGGRHRRPGRPDPVGQDEANPAPLVLLVAGHRRDQAVRVDAPGRRSAGRTGPAAPPAARPTSGATRPSRSARRASATIPTATASPCWIPAAVAGDGLDRRGRRCGRS